MNYTIASIFSLFGLNMYSQIPTEVPKPQDNSPVDFSEPVNIILFIVLPILVIIFVIIWRNKKQNDKAKQQ